MERTLLLMGLSFWSLALTTISNFATKISNPQLESNESYLSMSIAPDCSNQIAGTVFIDANFNGVNDSEAGASGIVVEVFDSNNSVGNATTDSNGEFSIAATTTGVDYRIEFSIPSGSDFSYSSKHGVGNGTAVQFAQAGTCINFGVIDLDEVCLPYQAVSTNLGTPFPDGKLLGAGNTFVSCGSIEDMPNSSRYVVGVMDFRNINFGNSRPEQVPPMFHHKSW